MIFKGFSFFYTLPVSGYNSAISEKTMPISVPIISLLAIAAILGFIVDKLLEQNDPYAIPFTFFSLISTVTAVMLLLLGYR